MRFSNGTISEMAFVILSALVPLINAAMAPFLPHASLLRSIVYNSPLTSPVSSNAMCFPKLSGNTNISSCNSCSQFSSNSRKSER